MKTFKIENEPKIESGFIIPENYFDHFSEKVMQQLPQKESKVITLFLRGKSWYYSAAAILILGLLITFYNQFYSHSSEIDDITLENYITNHSTISDEDLVNLLDERDIQKMSIDLNIEDKSIENELSTNTDIEQYITN